MKQNKIREIIIRLKKTNPSPKIELNYRNDFELLMAVVLSAQATDKGVNKATDQLFKVVSTPQQLLALGETGLKNYIKSIGLYNAKAKNLIATAKILVEKYNGQLPNNREELEKLPGVGRKTANIILGLVFDQPVIAVDTHVFRVANRTKMAVGKTPRQVEDGLVRQVPEDLLKNLHLLLVLHGRYVCKAKKPACAECVINDLCEYGDKNFT